MVTAVRPPTPVNGAYGVMSHPNDTIQSNRSGYYPGSGRMTASRTNSFTASNAESSTDIAQSGRTDLSSVICPARFHDEALDSVSQRGPVADGPSRPAMQRSDSLTSRAYSVAPSRTSTAVKKKSSLSRRPSLRRSGSRRSLRAGSVRSLNLGDKEKYGVEGAEDYNSAFYVPIPTNGNPTDALANRFQGRSFLLNFSFSIHF